MRAAPQPKGGTSQSSVRGNTGAEGGSVSMRSSGGRRQSGWCIDGRVRQAAYLTVFKTLPQYRSESVCMIWMTSKLASR